jgi:hypothetical protein
MELGGAVLAAIARGDLKALLILVGGMGIISLAKLLIDTGRLLLERRAASHKVDATTVLEGLSTQVGRLATAVDGLVSESKQIRATMVGVELEVGQLAHELEEYRDKEPQWARKFWETKQ